MNDDELDKRLRDHFERERDAALSAPAFESLWSAATQTHRRHLDRRRTAWVLSGAAAAALVLLAWLPTFRSVPEPSTQPLLLSDVASGYGVVLVEPMRFTLNQDWEAWLDFDRSAERNAEP